MILDPTFKIEKACSSDKSRPVLTACYLDADSSRLVATDSYQMAVVPVELEEGDTSGLIPAAALQAWRKSSSRVSAATLRANGSVDVTGPDGSASFPRPEGQFPKWDQLVDSAATGPDGALFPVLAEFGVNVAELAKCAAALGSEVVRVRVYSPLRPLHVTPAGRGANPDALGIVMPFRLS